jgi:hypothetical protein
VAGLWPDGGFRFDAFLTFGFIVANPAGDHSRFLLDSPNVRLFAPEAFGLA